MLKSIIIMLLNTYVGTYLTTCPAIGSTYAMDLINQCHWIDVITVIKGHII